MRCSALLEKSSLMRDLDRLGAVQSLGFVQPQHRELYDAPSVAVGWALSWHEACMR